MFRRWMCWTCGKHEVQTDATMDKLKETFEMLKEKEMVLIEKAFQEVEKAKEFARANNERAAIQCLKRKRLYEQQSVQLVDSQLRIHHQIIMLEGAEATIETLDALRTGAAAMEAMNIDDVDNIMNGIDEQIEATRRMQEAVSGPSGALADFDEDELEAELEELKAAESEEPILRPAATASAVPENVIAGLLPGPPVPQGSD